MHFIQLIYYNKCQFFLFHTLHLDAKLNYIKFIVENYYLVIIIFSLHQKRILIFLFFKL